MKELKPLADYGEQIEQCVKCGACQAHCPVFEEKKRESIVARGKVALAQALLSEGLALDDRFIADMSQCLLCGSCSDKCPNLVPTEMIVMAARCEIARRKGLTTFGKAMALTLKHSGLMKWMARGGHAFSNLLFKKVPQHSGLHLRFPAPYITPDRTLPEVAAKPFGDRHPEFIPGRANKPSITFFTGCMINFIYPDIGEALLKVFAFMGLNVYIPSEQNCCGLPALACGDAATVETLSRRNRKALDIADSSAIVTACASCNHGIGKDFNQPVIDVFAFLAENGLVEQLEQLPWKGGTVGVTYHDPCHLRNQKITRQPRSLLGALPSVHFVEMANADRCCGFGGTYSVHHYDTSKKIGHKKASDIAETGTDLVATACPGCMVQLQDSINHAGFKAKTIHVLELIACDLPI
jgi:glycolate oxidase iron-sulfur subunit